MNAANIAERRYNLATFWGGYWTALMKIAARGRIQQTRYFAFEQNDLSAPFFYEWIGDGHR